MNYICKERCDTTHALAIDLRMLICGKTYSI